MSVYVAPRRTVVNSKTIQMLQRLHVNQDQLVSSFCSTQSVPESNSMEIEMRETSFCDLLIIPSLVLACRRVLGRQVKTLHLVSKESKRVFVSSARHLNVCIGTLIARDPLEKVCRLLETSQLEHLSVEYGNGATVEDIGECPQKETHP